ncbi:MAG: hypothetical protein KF866_06410 [Phycisphaeraceae bacterium]|nr:hypothetical protein [Phycisphaeraceae bacterium]MCW5754627.1 hypothetical protein [Phycisphaeraceae bacterium]
MPRSTHRRMLASNLTRAVAAVAVSGTASAQTVEAPEWIYQHPGGSWGSEVPSHTRSIHVAPDGTIYATGRYNDSPIKLLVVAIAPDGTQLWDYVWENGGSFDIGDAITADAEGNLYITSETDLPGNDRALGVLSLTKDGNFRWDYLWEGQGLWCCFGPDITVGPDGHVYLTGSYQGQGMTNAQSRVGTMSLTTSGQVRWQRQWIPPDTDGIATGWRVQADASGNIYIAGRAAMRFLVLSYTADGDERWAYMTQGTSATHSNEAMGLAIGGDGNIYAGGRIDDIAEGRVFFVVSLTPDGDERWEYRYYGTAGLADRVNALIWGSDGNIYAGGKVVESSPSSIEAMFIVSLTPSGVERWRHYETFSAAGSPAFAVRTVRSLASDGAGNIYAVGYNYHVDSVRYAVASLTSGGMPRWLYIGTPGLGEDIAVHNDRVYAVGIMGTGQFDGNRLTVTSFEAEVGGTNCPADLSSSSDPNDPGYGVPDGVVDSSDFFFFLDQFAAGNLAIADMTGSSDPNDPSYGVPDGQIDAADFFYYLDIFVAPCP